MADKGPEREDGNESLSATAMFLRSYGAASPEPAAPPEPTPAVPTAEAPRAEAGEFTRMFRPLSAEPARPVAAASPVAPPVAPAAPSSAGGEFTRMFSVPNATEQPSPGQSAPAKAKGFSTPGVSDSASAEGNFTRMFRPEAQPLPPPSTTEPYRTEPDSFPMSHAAPPAPAFEPEVQPRATSPQSSGITDMFRALSPESEKYPQESAYKPEPVPVPRPYAEPTPIVVPGRPAQVSPSGGGVTELLNRLTQETPLMPGPPVPAVAARPTVVQETPVNAPPVDTRGEFTRIIQLAEAKQAAATAPPPPPPAAAGSAVPLPKVSVTIPPLTMPVAQPAPAALAAPHLAVPAAPKVQITPPALAATPAKSKLQEMLPLLLVANGFLMLILILLVVFALHRR